MIIITTSVSCENIFNYNYREHLDIGKINHFGRNFLIILSFIY